METWGRGDVLGCEGMAVDTDGRLPLKLMGPGSRGSAEEDFQSALAARGYHALLFRIQSYACRHATSAAKSVFRLLPLGQRKCKFPGIPGDAILRLHMSCSDPMHEDVGCVTLCTRK
jgi:hypothetical protein